MQGIQINSDKKIDESDDKNEKIEIQEKEEKENKKLMNQKH